ncbi:MAG: X2-like carbohydrate binding domain-containing protein [Bacteroidales bacterium]|nr:X2-like carbohydrate binding domain-containing protein [Bacteroidales bacterium]
MKLNYYYNQILKKIILFTVITVISSIFTFGQSISPVYETFSVLEPEDVQFSINWNGESEITSIIFYYWDDLGQYQEVLLGESTDYVVSGNSLTIFRTWIESISPETHSEIRFEAEFGSGYLSQFNIEVIYTYYPFIVEESKVFDLSNKEDVFFTIAWAAGDEVSSVSVDGTPILSSNYIINADYLYLKEDYLNTVLLAAGNSINVSVGFDESSFDSFVVEAVNSGITNPSLSQNEFDIDGNNMGDYVETIITWNGASAISSMSVLMVDNGFPNVFPFDDYTVTPINVNTATLRINIGGNKTSVSKAIDYLYVSVEIIFDAGSPVYVFLGIYDEYYNVQISSVPYDGGWTQGDGQYNVGEELTISAFSNPEFTFSKWIINGTQEVTDNPYTFNMPANDLIIDAVFLSDYLTVLYSNPLNGQSEVDVNTSIYLTFDRDIIEGTTNNGFDDISIQGNMGAPWPINSCSIMSGNILVIEPNLPLDINTQYFLSIPPEAVEGAANPGQYMNNPFNMVFSTGWGDYVHGQINPEENVYSLGNPDNVDFDVVWGEDTSIASVYFYYWDEFNFYQETELNSPADYLVDGNILSITNTFISSLSPTVSDELSFYAIFDSGWRDDFRINVVQTTLPYITPNAIDYDLSNPNDVFTNIIYNTAASISSVSLNSSNLIEGTDYEIQGSWLFIRNSYLSTHLTNVGNEISLDITFDTEDVSTLTITAIQSGIVNATIDPESETYNESDIPDYIDLTITWNDASSVLSLTIWEIENGSLVSYDFPDYTVTPINTETANLRVLVGAKGKQTNASKVVDLYNVTVEIEFDVGASAFYHLVLIEEYYYVYSEVYPASSGNVSGAWEYSLDEVVSLFANPNWGFDFNCWKIDGIIVSYDNPYEFNMPANDVYITAHFVPQSATLYDVTLVSNPVGAGILMGAGQYVVGETVTINLTENTGYEFINWTDATSNVVATNPEYSFIMTDTNVELTANFNDQTNIDELSIEEFDIYPNPFSDILYINNYQSASKISFTTITGQIITEFNNFNNSQINTSDLPKGFYLLIIENIEGQRFVKKILKQ